MVRVALTPDIVELIKRPVEGQGGLQSLLRRLNRNLSPDGSLNLSDTDVERIRRYASKYGQGGFEDRLKPLVLLIEQASH